MGAQEPNSQDWIFWTCVSIIGSCHGAARAAHRHEPFTGLGITFRSAIRSARASVLHSSYSCSCVDTAPRHSRSLLFPVLAHAGAMQCVIDLLGPPPAAVISWEQEQLKPSQSPHSPALGPPACTGPAAPAAAPSMEQQTHEQRQWQQNSSSIRGRLPNASTTGSATQHVRLSELRTAGSMTRHVSMSGGGGSEGGELDVQPKLPASESSLNRRRK